MPQTGADGNSGIRLYVDNLMKKHDGIPCRFDRRLGCILRFLSLNYFSGDNENLE